MIDRSVERFIQDRMIATRMPALSLVVLRGDALQERHFGFRDLRRRLSPTGTTRYGLGSVTKVFTAMAVHQAAEAGLCDLDDPIAKYLGALGEPFGQATVAHLLAHASGLPALGWSETKMSHSWPMDGYPIGNLDDLATFMDEASGWSAAEPGLRWFYSNEGYILLGALLEQVFGMPYREVVAQRILGPLGMSRSTFDIDQVEGDEDRVQPVMLDSDGELRPGANLYGEMPAAGGLVSSSGDMAQLARLMMRRGLLPDGTRLLAEGSWERMGAVDVEVDQGLTPLSAWPLWQDPRRTNGAGLQRHLNLFGSDVYGHGGGVMGGTAYLAAVPERDLGVVLLSNAHGYPMAQFALFILASLMGEDPEQLPFVKRQRIVAAGAGRYHAYRSTIQGNLEARPWGFDLVFDMQPRARAIPMVLFDHDEVAGVARLMSLGGGVPGFAELHLAGADSRLVYERYSLKRVGGPR
jgi:CubicO group peptidase (beta-lactamase class C family)